MLKAKLMLACGTALGLNATPAVAQQSGGDQPPSDTTVYSGEIVVTATKRSSALKDIPQSIAALSADMLESRGVVDIAALSRQTPGVVMEIGNDRSPNVVMRGIGAFGNTQGVGFYIDDVQNFTDQTMRLQDLERVEVLKGPQGTLYGGSSIGGAIRYIPKEPNFDFGGEVMAEAGGYGYRNIYGAVNAPLSQDKVAVRISAYYNHDDGFWTSPTIPDISETEEFAVRGQLLFTPSEDLTIKLTGRYRSYDGSGILASAQNAVDDVNYVASLNAKPFVKSKTYGFVGSANYDFGGIELDWISSYTKQDKNYLGDVDYTDNPIIILFTDDPRPTKVLTQEVRLSSNGNETFDWIFGLYAANLKNVNLSANPVNADVGIVLPDFFDFKAEQTDLAAFASSDLRLGDLTVTTGLRLYHVDYDADLFIAQLAPVNQHFQNNDTVILPRLALSYQTAGGNNIYASVSRGYEPGRAALTSNDPGTYKPEKTWAFEVGSKGNIGGRSLYYEIAGFYTLYTDRQFETRVQLQSGAFVETIANIGDSTAYGAEASLNWNPTPNLTLNGSIGYLHSDWDKGALFNGVNISGRDTPNAPEWTGNIGATYTAPLSDSVKAELHFDASYKDAFRWKLGYEPVSSINPSYWLASAYFALSETDDRWKLSARVSNLFNQDYFIDFTPEQFGAAGADGTCTKCHLGYVGERRRITVSASLNF